MFGKVTTRYTKPATTAKAGVLILSDEDRAAFIAALPGDAIYQRPIRSKEGTWEQPYPMLRLRFIAKELKLPRPQGGWRKGLQEMGITYPHLYTEPSWRGTKQLPGMLFISVDGLSHYMDLIGRGPSNDGN